MLSWGDGRGRGSCQTTPAELAVRDRMTQLYNRREFQRRLIVELEFARCCGEPLGLLLVDIDSFKAINDRFGLDSGDEVLRWVAERVEQGVRPTDIVARNGIDELAVLLPQTSRAGLVATAERIRATLARGLPAERRRLEIPLTVSIGAACCHHDALIDDAFVTRADQGLQEARRAGGNRVAFVAR
jgi:two-component system cell cycle response regulator